MRGDQDDLDIAIKDWLQKSADQPEAALSLSGVLYVTPANWGLLSVPNGFVRSTFAALDEAGVELPSRNTNNSNSYLNAHISVFRPDEIEEIGGPDKLRPERGKRFRYNIGPLKTVRPDGWDGDSRVWFVSVTSPELMELRRSYGLTPLPNNNKYPFHITVGIRRTSVLQNNILSKGKAAAAPREIFRGLQPTCERCQTPWESQGSHFLPGCQHTDLAPIFTHLEA